MCSRTCNTHWIVAEVLKIWCCPCIRQIDWQISVSAIFALSTSTFVKHLDWAWRHCEGSSSIPVAMVYFTGFDHKKRLNSPLTCALCSNLNLMDWAQTWIRAAAVQVQQLCWSWAVGKFTSAESPQEAASSSPPGTWSQPLEFPGLCWFKYFFSHS